MQELRPGVDLREEIALMGDDLRAALDDRKLGAWGTEPRREVFSRGRAGSRWFWRSRPSRRAVTALPTWTSLRPFLFVVLAELIFMMATNKATGRVARGRRHSRA